MGLRAHGIASPAGEQIVIAMTALSRKKGNGCGQVYRRAESLAHLQHR